MPKSERALNHVSKPLRRQMRGGVGGVDRTRWPVLVTYSDEGQGHTGHVYRCSGWEPTARVRRAYYVDGEGRRASSYANGAHGTRGLTRGGTTVLQRWEHWACDRGEAAIVMALAGWRRVPVPGERWRSGSAAHTWVKEV